VALPALSLYATLLIALAFSGPAAPQQVQQLAWKAACWLSLLAGAAAIWFIALQAFVVGSFCTWCLTVHACGIGLAAMALAMSWQVMGWQSLSNLRTGMAFSIAGVALLAAGQWLQPTPSTQVAFQDVVNKTSAPPVRLEVSPPAPADANPASGSNARPPSQPPVGVPKNDPPNWADDLVVEPPPPPENTAPVQNPENPGQNPSVEPLDQAHGLFDPPPPPVERVADPDPPPPIALTRRIVSVLDRKAEIDVYQHPILGSPSAKHIVVKLFDYTCPHCRVMHGHLNAARERFGSDFAVVMLPVPMNTNCNQFIRQTDAKHLDACHLAKLALAVWRADPGKFEAFDAWLFAPVHPPSTAEARAKAVQLVGAAALARELEDWTLGDRLAVGVKLYGLADQGAIPKVLVPPSGMIRGRVDNRDDVLQFLQQFLNITSTSPLTPAADDEELVP
jgi:hypothetical protein